MTELSEQSRELVKQARRSGVRAPPGARARMRRAVISAVGVATAAAAAPTAKLVVVALISAAVGASATLAVTQRDPRRTGAPTTVERVQPAAPAPVPVAAPTPEPLEVEPPPAPATPPQRQITRPRAVVAPLPAVVEPEPVPVPEDPGASLSAEIEALSEAAAATEAAEWDRAERALARYQRQFREGALRTEASALEVLVLCGRGKTTEARRLADELALNQPFNPSVRKLESSCARAPP